MNKMQPKITHTHLQASKPLYLSLPCLCIPTLLKFSIMGVSLPHILQVMLWQEVIRKDVERHKAEILGGSHTDILIK